MKALCKAIFAFLLASLPAPAQLHLITGSPDSKSPIGYTSGLFRVSGQGAIESVEDLVTDSQGTDWIAASQELRKAVLVPELASQPVVVVDFDKAGVVKKCEKPKQNTGLIEQWLWDPPAKGPAYVEFLAVGSQVKLRAMVLDPSVPCSESFVTEVPSDAKYLVASSSGAVAHSGSGDYMAAMIEKDGTVSRFFPYGTAKAYFDYQVPTSLSSEFEQPNTFVEGNNAQIFVLCLFDDGRPASRRILIFRKSDKSWHRMPDFGEGTSFERAFGNYIAVAAALRKGSTQQENAGRAEWRTEPSKTGPSVSALFQRSPFVFPGRLYLYDTSNERVYSIDTKQGDSEILLVEDGVVYYRASDRLYSATITASGLTPGRLLATSDIIRDAHWAFIKH